MNPFFITSFFFSCCSEQECLVVFFLLFKKLNMQEQWLVIESVILKKNICFEDQVLIMFAHSNYFKDITGAV